MIENGMLDYSESGSRYKGYGGGFGPFRDDELFDTYYPEDDDDDD